MHLPEIAAVFHAGNLRVFFVWELRRLLAPDPIMGYFRIWWMEMAVFAFLEIVCLTDLERQ
jgi:hypothetical protein